jgi:membrane protein
MSDPEIRSRFARYSANVWLLLKDSVRGWMSHEATRTGAALAFYTVFSLAPILLLSMAIAGFFFGERTARGEIFEQISELIGPAGAATVQTVLEHAGRSGDGTLTTIISVLTLIIGANTALVELKSGLDQIWDVPPERRQGFWYFIRTQLLSVGVILSLAFMLLVSLVISAALTALEKLSRGEELLNVVLEWVNQLFSFVLVAALFGTIYKVLPSVRIAWRDVMVGAVVTAALFTVGKFAIGAYIGNSGLASTYGAAGSVILVLLWVYYSAQIFLFGAEFTRSYAYRFGTFRPEKSDGADQRPAGMSSGA